MGTAGFEGRGGAASSREGLTLDDSMGYYVREDNMPYHLNPRTSEPNKCSARKGACPFGGEHFESRSEALYAAEVKLTNEIGGSFGPSTRKPATDALSSMAAARQQSPRTSAQDELKASMQESIAGFSSWWEERPGLTTAVQAGGIAAAGLALLGGGAFGGHAVGQHIGDQTHGDQEVVKIVESEAVVKSFDSNGKAYDTMVAEVDGKQVTIESDMVVEHGSDVWNEAGIISEDSVGDTVTLYEVTYRNTANDETVTLENQLLEDNDTALAQKAAERDATGAAEEWGGLAGMLASTATIVGITAVAMSRRGASGYGGGYGYTSRSNSIARASILF